MARNRFGARLLAAARDPWALLLSAFGGGASWAMGASVLLSAGTAVVMLSAATVVGALTGRSDAPEQLGAGTVQAELIGLLDSHLRSLRGLRTQALPRLAQTAAVEATVAADSARRSALRVAAAVDALDEAISAARTVPGQGEHATRSIRETVQRLTSRRDMLLDRLTVAVDEVATVYTGLLELTATAGTMDVSVDSTDVTAVADSVTLLRTTFAELEADAATLGTQGPL